MTGGPSPMEYIIVARMMLETGTLIGSPAEIWTHPSTARALRTFRMCVQSVGELMTGKHGIYPSALKACVMLGCGDVPFMLDEIAEFMLEDSGARDYWRSMCPSDHWPHRCPRCGAAAFIGFNQIDCRAGCR